MPKQSLEPKEKTMIGLSVGHAHKLAQIASATQNYVDLQAIADAVLTSANIFGSAAEYHNLAAEYARTDDYYSAYRIVEKGITQQTVFLKADIPERYGYKLLSGEKHTLWFILQQIF